MARQGNFFSCLTGEEGEVDAADLAAKIEAERQERLRKEKKQRLKEEEERRLKDEKEWQLNPQYVKSETVRGGGSGRGSGKSFRNHGEMNGYQQNSYNGYRRNNGGEGNGGAEGYRRTNRGVDGNRDGGGRGRGQKERTGGGYSRPPPVADSTTGAGVGAENSRPRVVAAVPSVEDPLHFPVLGKKAMKA